MKSAVSIVLLSLGLSQLWGVDGTVRGARDKILNKPDLDSPKRRRLAPAPVDVLFIIDESDSMSEEQNDVRQRVKEIFNQLPPGSAVGLVGYGQRSSIFSPRPGAPEVHTPLTSDSDQFQDAANNLEATGTYEPAYLALYQSVANDFSIPLGFRGNKFCTILITDESSNGSGVTQAETINALNGGTNTGLQSAFFGITVDGSVRQSYERIADETGGAMFRLEDFRQDPSFVLTPVLEACTVAVLDNILLDPAADRKMVGETHTVMAAVLKIVDDSVIDVGVIGDGILDPQSGVAVTFEVVQGPNVGTTGFCTADSGCMTDEVGRLSFTYVGDGGEGIDDIEACFTDSMLETKKCARVAVEWMDAPTTSPLAVPTFAPSLRPSAAPVAAPTFSPTGTPSMPSSTPSIPPTQEEKSENPSVAPTAAPSDTVCPLEKDDIFVLDQVEFPGDTRTCKWLQKPVGDRLSIYCSDLQSSASQDCPLTCGRCDSTQDSACEEEERNATFVRDVNGAQDRDPTTTDPELINVRRCKWLVKGQNRLQQFCPRSTSTAADVCPCNCALM